MKPRFEEHEGKLFCMLDKPVPLKEKDTNVLVQFITHGIIGEYVMEHWLDCGQENAPIFVDSVDSDGDVTVCIENGNEHHCCPFPMFEIIGTFVKEGSDKWALYQMMKGNKVMNIEWIKRKSKDLKYCCCENGMLVYNPEYVLANPIPIEDFLTPLLGLVAISDGWQIYKEPEPEPIFTIGDKVTDGVIDGTIIHIEDAIADVCPSTDEYKIELRNLNHISESPKQDDVEKPLRSMIAEAKAIGKNIRTYYQDIVFTPQALEACLNQGEFRWWNICNWELTTREQNYFPSISTSSDRSKEEPQHAKEPIADCDNCKHRCPKSNIDYCHMYEPKPTSFKVGDWVEHKESKEQATIRRIMSYGAIEIEFAYSTESDIYQANDFHNDFRKLSPSEVIVRIGCLSGTVRCCENEFICPESTPNNPCHFVLQNQITGFWSIIYFKMLDAPTRELVQSLLKAQIKEKEQEEK